MKPDPGLTLQEPNFPLYLEVKSEFEYLSSATQFAEPKLAVAEVNFVVPPHEVSLKTIVSLEILHPPPDFCKLPETE
jgi:hypothetical protein